MTPVAPVVILVAAIEVWPPVSPATAAVPHLGCGLLHVNLVITDLLLGLLQNLLHRLFPLESDEAKVFSLIFNFVEGKLAVGDGAKLREIIPDRLV